jgi:hypothetical protein
MPRDPSSGVYTLPANTLAISATGIQSIPYNTVLNDLLATLNSRTPEFLGGVPFATWALAKADVISSVSTTALIKTNNLSDLASIATARTNLGLGTAALVNQTAIGTTLMTAVDAAAVRTAAGLGTAAVLNTGTAASNVVQYATANKLPSADGSALTGLKSGFAEYDKGVLAQNTTYTNAHGLTGYPANFEVWIECTTADIGYAVGQRLKISNTSNTTIAVQIGMDATNVFVKTRSLVTFTALDASNNDGTITNARWKVIFRVFP